MPRRLILFTGRNCPACAPAKTAAREAALSSGIQFEERDAQDERVCAALYGINSVPALVLISSDGLPRVTTRAQSRESIMEWINGG
jgi:glutaredoxin